MSEDLFEINALLKAEVDRLKKFNDEALAHIAKEERKSRERLDMEQAEVERLEQQVKYWRIEAETDHARWMRVLEENERLKSELKFSEHRMIALAEALADTRLGYQKKIEILKEGRINRKGDQEALKKANQGKPSRPGMDGKIVRNKPSKSGGTY